MDKNQNNIQALITLLDDEDRGIFDQVRNTLIELGTEVVPQLEAAWEESFNPILQQRIEEVVNQIQFKKTTFNLKKWIEGGGESLLEGWLILTKYQYPDMDEEKLKRQVERIKKDIWIEINDVQTAMEKVKVINHLLFSIHGFSGNTTNYYAPGNNFLNNLLESKKGNSVSLSALYILFAEILDVSVYGVNLPGHFILCYKDESPESVLFKLLSEERVLFYMNPLNRGAIFGRQEIDVFLKKLHLESRTAYYQPCTNSDILLTLINNLIKAYQDEGRKEKVIELEYLGQILSLEK